MSTYELLKWAHTLLRALLAVTLVVLAGLSLVHGEPFAHPWLAWKVGAFGLIIAAGLGIRAPLPTFETAFGAIVAAGSTPARESELRRGVLGTYPYVFGIWALVLVIGLLGMAKP